MHPGCSVRRSLGCLASVLALLGPAKLDAEEAANTCPRMAALPGSGPNRTGARLRPGMHLTHEQSLQLRPLLPPEVWRLRDEFFHPGMRLEVGPCYRAYARAQSYEDATHRNAGRSHLDADGNLLGYEAGLPFPPERFAPDAPDAALRWAWNVEWRHRGPGIRGPFRLVDMPGRVGRPQTYEGTWSFLQTGHRADLADGIEAKASAFGWVAGGRFDAPHGIRHLAWRQQRGIEAKEEARRPDDTFIYVPSLGKVRRAATPWVDGLYMPRYRASQAAGAANATSTSSIQVTEHLRRGLVGLSMRPNAYRWRMRGERDVLAPLNVTRPGFPTEAQRTFGPSGLSAGDDRWDVRRAVVIEGALRTGDRDYDFLTLYIDAQNQQPLYYLTHRRGREVVDVGILLHRYTGDRAPEPIYPDGSPIHAFEPVAAVFYDGRDGSGWRRESYDLRMTAPTPTEIQALLSGQDLTRGH